MHGFKEIVVKYCKNCRRYFNRNRWIKANVKEGVKAVAKVSIKADTKGKKIDIMPLIPEHKAKGKLNINIEVKINKESYLIPAAIMFTVCDRCSREKSKYYEGVLQLRKPTDKIIDYIEKELEKLKQKGIFVTKEEKVKNGFDFYITNKRAIMTIGRKLKQHFTGQLKISPKLQTMDKRTSKLVYKTNVLFKPICLKKNEVIELDDRKYRVKSIGKRIIAVELKTGKKVSISMDEFT